MITVIVLIGLAVLIALAATDGGDFVDGRQEVIVIRRADRTGGCGLLAMFLLGVMAAFFALVALRGG